MKRSAVAAAMIAATVLGLTPGCSEITQQSVVVGGEAVETGPVYALPRSVVIFDIVQTVKPEQKLDVTASFDTVADTRTRYRVGWNESAFADDEFTLGIDERGLLNTAVTKVTDRSPEITAKLLEIVTEAAKFQFYGLDPTRSKAAAEPKSFALKLVVDPFHPTSSRQATQQMMRVAGIEMTISDIAGGPIATIDDREVARVAAACDGSVCFRPPLPVLFTLRATAGNKVTRFVETFPDPHHVIRFDIRRGACIQRTTDLTFVKGSLTKVALTKPSEVLGCLAIPLSLVKAVVAIPAAALTGDTTRAKAEKENLEAQEARLRAHEALLAARAAAPAPK